MPRTKTTLETLVLALVVLALAASPAAAVDENNLVSIIGFVEPATQETINFVVFQGISQISIGDFNNLLRPGGQHRLFVTSIAAHLNTGPFPPAETDYASFFLGSCLGSNGGIHGFGAGSLVVGGTRFEQHNLAPGMVVWLDHPHSQLCLMSSVQSTATAHVQIHGYLQRVD